MGRWFEVHGGAGVSNKSLPPLLSEMEKMMIK